jgi:hypothetical protein
VSACISAALSAERVRLEDRYGCTPTRALGGVDTDDERSGLEDYDALFAGARL